MVLSLPRLTGRTSPRRLAAASASSSAGRRTIFEGRTGSRTERGARGREPRDGKPEGRAGHVVEPELVAERDRGRVPAVLAADAELELWLDIAPLLRCDPHERADAIAVYRLERVALV